MAKTGRKPKPTSLKVLSGTRADRINRSEPPRIDGEITPPGTMKGEALDEWNRVVPILKQMALLSRIDRTALVIHCLAYGRFMKAEAKLDEELVTTTAAGGIKSSPYLQISKDAAAIMFRFLSEFGGTPSARSRLEIAKVTLTSDALSDFLRNA